MNSLDLLSAWRLANSTDTDQTAALQQSDQHLHCLLGQMRIIIYGYYVNSQPDRLFKKSLQKGVGLDKIAPYDAVCVFLVKEIFIPKITDLSQ